MAMESIESRSKQLQRTRLIERVTTTGTGFILAAAFFFIGSGILTPTGQPGASTPIPWMLSHAFWVLAITFVAIGCIRLVRHTPVLRTGIAGYVAAGLIGLGLLHSLQWTTWVYVDVIAYEQGTHSILLPALFHPFGTGHMLMFAIIIGSTITTLAWALPKITLIHRVIPWFGGIIGMSTLFAGGVSLLTFAAVRSPSSLFAILSIAISFAWLFAVGVALYRNASQPTSDTAI